MVAPFPSPTTKWHDNTYPTLSPSRPELSAKGKSVIITGGGTGIGAETARSFAEAGAARIAILGRREQPLLDTKASVAKLFPKTEVYTYSTDVQNKELVDAAFDEFASNANGKIDVLVSGAARTGPTEPIEEVDIEGFLSTVDMNLRGSLIVAQAFLRHAAPDSTVIDVNSSAAHVNFATMFSAYTVSKLSVFRMWDHLAFARPDIHIYHTQPGIVDTEMNREAGGVKAAGFEDHVSLPANFNVWLASPEARFLKGKFLWVNWDVDELKLRAEELQSSKQLDITLSGWPFDVDGWQFKGVNGAWRT